MKTSHFEKRIALHAAEFLCLPRVDLEMSRMFLEQVAACDPQAEHVIIQDQSGFHLNPELQEA